MSIHLIPPNSTDEEIKEFEENALRRARITSIMLGLSAVVTVLFMIYGFTQSIEAQRQQDLRYELEVSSKKEITNLKEQLAQCQSEKK
ncbi:MAG TPA: hypothetical protein PLR06_00500 [Cyclobacteriaceae bacterium]|nr:hypothetical protein [Cyclobacteriaceae bacterium]